MLDAHARVTGILEQPVPSRIETVRARMSAALAGKYTIEGWLLRAEGRSGPMPVLDEVHGGPAAYALLDYDTAPYWQVLCCRGWAGRRSAGRRGRAAAARR